PETLLVPAMAMGTAPPALRSRRGAERLHSTRALPEDTVATAAHPAILRLASAPRLDMAAHRRPARSAAASATLSVSRSRPTGLRPCPAIDPLTADPQGLRIAASVSPAPSMEAEVTATSAAAALRARLISAAAALAAADTPSPAAVTASAVEAIPSPAVATASA